MNLFSACGCDNDGFIEFTYKLSQVKLLRLKQAKLRYRENAKKVREIRKIERMKIRLLLLLLPIFCHSQTIIRNDSIIITLKFKIEHKTLFFKDTIYHTKKNKIRVHNDSLFIYGKKQYLKNKL